MATQVEDKFMGKINCDLLQLFTILLTSTPSIFAAMNVEAATRFRTFQPTAMTITKER